MFFVVFGLNTDPGRHPAGAGLAVVLAAVTDRDEDRDRLVGRAAAGHRQMGPAARAGAALVARGEFSIVIAGPRGLRRRGRAASWRPLATAYVLLLAVLGPSRPGWSNR